MCVIERGLDGKSCKKRPGNPGAGGPGDRGGPGGTGGDRGGPGGIEGTGVMNAIRDAHIYALHSALHSAYSALHSGPQGTGGDRGREGVKGQWGRAIYIYRGSLSRGFCQIFLFDGLFALGCRRRNDVTPRMDI